MKALARHFRQEEQADEALDPRLERVVDRSRPPPDDRPLLWAKPWTAGASENRRSHTVFV
jgi:hypothetical protein